MTIGMISCDDLPSFTPDWQALSAADSEGPFIHAGVETLKCIGTVAAYCASVKGNHPHARDAAIRCGLMVRAAKLCKALVRDAVRDDGEMQIGLSRMLTETLVNIEFLCSDESGRWHQAYVLDSLVSEKDFLRTIQERIDSDPERIELEIEKRMRASVGDALRLARVSPEEIPGRRKSGWPSAKERFEKVYGAPAYLSFRGGSDALHGGWYDLVRNHLNEANGGFEPDFEGVRLRPHVLVTASILTCRAGTAYASRTSPPEKSIFTPAFKQLGENALRIDHELEKYLQK